MWIAKDDEGKRSRIWGLGMLISSALIVIIAIFFLMKMFTSNPLEGRWISEDNSLILHIQRDGVVEIDLGEVPDAEDTKVQLSYVIDRDAKVFTIKDPAHVAQTAVEDADSEYTGETVGNTLDAVITSFTYSVDHAQLTLTEREYGEQLFFYRE